ncbi:MULTISPECIES: hypothetical protein [Flavobacterium]|uniref:hypothetical protein n=1 Tax=Flavobacterium TaxID=237 RepID=UPI000F77A9FF|nr:MULTISPECIES: hypothetical protein [Flavobacterium]MDP5200217.1 hypothetical protein [Flavobacterium sp. DG2-3]
MLDALSNLIQLSEIKDFKTTINREQVIQSKNIINSKPSSTKALFVILCAMNLINAAIKTKEFRGEIYYGMLKKHVSKLLVYVTDNHNIKFDAQIYIDKVQNCVYIEVYDLQFSFHNITIYDELNCYINSPKNTKTVWKEIQLQKIAGELLTYALSAK